MAVTHAHTRARGKTPTHQLFRFSPAELCVEPVVVVVAGVVVLFLPSFFFTHFPLCGDPAADSTLRSCQNLAQRETTRKIKEEKNRDTARGGDH